MNWDTLTTAFTECGRLTMRNYQTGKEMQHEDGRDKMQQQVREFLARSKADLTRPRLKTRWCEVQHRYVEVA